jgi:metal-responsive CopG/Arc/MetJ family transcriptional regulator
MGSGVTQMVQNKTTKKKSTFFLNEQILAEIKEIVPAKGLRSQNALVEEALNKYIAEYKREVLRKQYLEASQDPQFLADIQEVGKDFQHADAETARMIP